jgi:hypothetical protein
MTDNLTPFEQIVASITPAYTYQGIAFYNYGQIFTAIDEAEGFVPSPSGWVSTYDGGYNEAQIDAVAEALDAVVYGYPREYPGFMPMDSEGIALALRHTARAVIWEDLS